MRKLVWIILILLTVSMPAAAQDGQTPILFHDAPPDPAAYQLVTVAEGFHRPILLTNAGDGSGRLFVVQQSGRVRIVAGNGYQDPPFLDVSGIISPAAASIMYSERGLLGLAFHPDFAENGQVFIDYTDLSGNTVVARYTVMADNPDQVDPASATVLLQVRQPYANHNGGHLAFGPDGYLYIALGDGGSAGDPNGNGQNPQALLGKILRLDVDAGDPYGIPADNPYLNNPDLAPEVWAWGLRNPWRYSFDRATGDLYIADVGQNLWEEVNFQPADSPGGENYGWNIMEATHPYSGAPIADSLVLPFTEYAHDQGCSITGGYVYRGTALPDLQGIYFFGDWCTGRIWSSYRDEAGDWHTNEFMQMPRLISSFGEDENGELYVVDYNGVVLRLEAAQ
ncbi:MAG: PQQ-dependent sugar dehydrogenase [Anaerolineaceae bacterium]|nr:PQQ-dependent sugar dehydrogenase [Anaerolineaceae bacterium]